MQSVIITGANTGIGFATACRMASDKNWHVVLACRNPQKAEGALKELRQKHPGASASILPLDLLSLRSIRDFAGRFEAQSLPPLGGLILNAGGINMKAKSLEFSEDGSNIFSNHFFGHFVLTNLLVNQLKAPVRIVSCRATCMIRRRQNGRIMPPRYGPVEDAAYGRGLYAKMPPMARYGTAKMFAMMCAAN